MTNARCSKAPPRQTKRLPDAPIRERPETDGRRYGSCAEWVAARLRRIALPVGRKSRSPRGGRTFPFAEGTKQGYPVHLLLPYGHNGPLLPEYGR